MKIYIQNKQRYTVIYIPDSLIYSQTLNKLNIIDTDRFSRSNIIIYFGYCLNKR